MVKPFAALTMRRFQSSTKQRIVLMFFALSLAACAGIDYDIEPKNMFAAPSKNKNIGVVRFHFTEDGQPYEMRVRRVKSGHAMQASLIDETADSRLNFTMSRTHELNYFVGVEGRYAF
jgi:hypothetical protein